MDSDRYHACPVESRLLFLELLLCADDYGLVPIGDVYLRRHTTVCEGKSTAQIASFLGPMLESDLIRPYTSERGGRFAFIPRFDNRPRAIKPRWPLPPPGLDEGYISTMIPKSEQFRINELRQKRSTDGLQTGGETENRDRNREDSPLKDPLLSSEPSMTLIPCPQQEIVALWKKMLPGLRPPRSWGADRQRHLAARWRELLIDDEFKDKDSGLEWFGWFFEFIGQSPFLTGKVPGMSGKVPFTASLDWVILPANFAKIIDRKYHAQRSHA